MAGKEDASIFKAAKDSSAWGTFSGGEAKPTGDFKKASVLEPAEAMTRAKSSSSEPRSPPDRADPTREAAANGASPGSTSAASPPPLTRRLR